MPAAMPGDETDLGKQARELVEREIGLTDNGAQRSAGDFLMVGDCQWLARGMTKVDVAPVLVSDRVAGFLGCFGDSAPGDDGQPAHTETSIRVSLTAPLANSGNPSAARDRR